MTWTRIGLFLLATLPMFAAGNGLKGEYFNNTGLVGSPTVVRTDATVNFEWWGTPATGISNNYFSARWSGKVEAPVTGAYKLATYSNAGIRVWLNGTLIINNWATHWTEKDTSVAINLTAGQQYDLKIEYRENEGSAVAKLLWSYPGQGETVVPQARLYSDAVASVAAPVYLSELNPVVSENGWGRYERDRSNGESRYRDGRTLEINDVYYGRGLGVHAASDLRFQLFGKYKSFYTDLGVDDEVGASRGSVIFEVWLDGTRKYVSGLRKGADPVLSVALDVTGVNELKLKVLDGGDGISYDHADWAGARVSTAALGTSNPNPTPAPQPPAMPSGFTVTPGNSQVQLAWNATQGATSYVVFRGTVSGGAAAFTTSVTSPSFKDTSVTNGTMYYYRVGAMNGALAGPPTAEVSAMPQSAPAPPPPAVPTGLSATSGNTQVTLTWNAVSGATGYRVFRSTVSGVQGDQVASGQGTSYFTVGLTNGTTYFFSVAAVNANGVSAASAQVSATPTAPNQPPPPLPPAVPTGLSATPGNAQVSLSWNSVAGATGYTLYRSTASGVQGSAVITNTPATSFLNTALINGTTYFYSVAALNGNGSSMASAQVSAKPVAPPAPPAPTGLSATAGNAAVTLNWTGSQGAASYNIYRSTSSGGQGNAPIMTGITGLTFKNTGLVNGTMYYFKVAAVNSNGTGAKSTEASAKPAAAPGPPAPTGLSAAPGNAEATLTWNAAAGAVSYNIYRSTSSGGQGDAPIMTGITALTFKNTGLVNGTKYYFKVAAVNENGAGAKSNEASVTPVAPPAPPAPTGLTAAPGNAEVTLTWAASAGAATYNMYRSTTSGGQTDPPLMTGIVALTFKDTGLTNGTTYYYKVAAVNTNGTGTKSNQATAKPVLPPVPPAPTGLTTTGGNAQITLVWNASSTAVTYNVYRGTTSSNQGDVPLASGIAALTFTDTTAVNGTTYFYKVAGVSPSGIGTRSSAVSGVASPPAIVLTPEQMSAFRFLRQSTWGPTPALRDRVVQIGKAAFLDEQFALPATPYPDALITMPNMELVSEQFFQNALQGQDQLRQRVAWALSQIWVASAIKVDNTHAMVPYIRILQENAFGNVRDVLEKITLSPAMGEFLDMINNKKASGTAPNIVMPNENFARELMQLFTIGLTGLNPDGSSTNVPSYNQTDILELSRALTGWTYGDNIAGDPTKINSRFYTGPMEPVANFHDTGSKTLFAGTPQQAVFPANQTARQDLTQALNVLFNHPNMGPFLVRQLIQRLVKSNPSPAYIGRVAAVFANNGQGVRGDLRAIVRAILLDTEAETVPNTGKFSEPALFLTTIARGLNSTVTDHPYMTDFSQDMSQRVWFAPSVFNYFSPGYRSSAVPGGVAGPELQIWSTATAMTRTNFVASLVSGGFGTKFTIDTTPYQPVAGNPAALVDTANAFLMGGAMGPEMRQAIITALASSTSNTDRIRTVLYLIGSSMQYQVEH